MKDKTYNLSRVLQSISRSMYFFLGTALCLASFVLAGVCTIKILISFNLTMDDSLLGYVSYLIISVAIFDVGRYLIEEEVLRDRELRSAREARQSITKFMVIIVIAVTLEALLHLLRLHHRLNDLIYPGFLLLVAGCLLVGLGIFQRLSSATEKDVEKESGIFTNYDHIRTHNFKKQKGLGIQ